MINVFGRSIGAPSHLTRLVLLSALSVALMMLDHRGHHLEKIRAGLNVLAYPIQIIASAPAYIGRGIADFFTTRGTLREDNEKLLAERQSLLARLQQFEPLEQENRRLRQMLVSAALVADKAIAAELVEVSSEPFTRKVVVAKGSQDGVYVGQSVIDAHGVMGQVTQVAGHVSRVTLITDAGHAIPVLNNRSGLRALVFGTGNPDTVKVPYLTANADIKEGDLLVSSGMGGTFPPGYPVARVVKIVNDPNEAFLAITAKPAAQLNHGKQVLLIWRGNVPQSGGKSK
ncbi:MAG: rod shape-determining protein MreC [Candidatus Muproteobacteria bacterium RIFCSPHIGHO2_12_FULL_60_33]|uniref:Cell shape-determining protein MreC n=1 Tax=Candidatus Muproteobacteria bacterium RIFCSPLOWO2_01_FULL_60_18 TaxID=1817768 RepID=A0A1F6TYI4_9PROT|nr:MAG: rod shape-determining protein MreC [Candidatus Muproteobacteria bacterium RIFCSPLOWO2_01_FULL_60_18]OGI53559.1 MAG: rod shape-determining protein MreC [Candidatus Muproteobacteria bacterium RIFCSPHIGHO2_12_FULL_60_33]OGI54239.1 MAG: rod shape-determining protein MreC [Candidatus Muproteobacteria bacterium RIFCSPHIGHO2_02_FULL_60_13]OGI59188.1 MAG: rod shape-determining protein MreC [Candidatus Muproteobacteria bacterium RIFCSPHIGHO2_01_FULL_61_200]